MCPAIWAKCLVEPSGPLGDRAVHVYLQPLRGCLFIANTSLQRSLAAPTVMCPRCATQIFFHALSISAPQTSPSAFECFRFYSTTYSWQKHELLFLWENGDLSSQQFPWLWHLGTVPSSSRYSRAPLFR